MELVKKDGKTYVVINDYEKVRDLFGRLLAEIQRINPPVTMPAPMIWWKPMP